MERSIFSRHNDGVIAPFIINFEAGSMIAKLIQHQFYPESPFDLFTLRLRGTQIEIGEDLARVAQEHHDVDLTATPIAETDLQAQQRLLSRYCPALVERGAGAANYFGRDRQALYPYSLPLVQEPPPFACSAAFLGEKNGGFLVRNFDFTLRSFPELLGATVAEARPMIDPVYLMTIEPETGFRSITVVATDLFTNAFDGINDRGFCIALLAVSNGAAQFVEPGFDAFDEITVPRILLESCATVEEAIALFSEMPKQTVFIPCHYIIGDRHGNAAVLEWHETSGMGIVRRGKSQPLLCTNHYLSSLHHAIAEAGHEAESRQRLATLGSHLPQDLDDDQGLWRAAEAVRMSALDEDGSIIGGTLWTALYRTALPGLDIRFLKQARGKDPVYSQAYSARFD
ncbi:MAG: C45 family peptidase [Cyanobacteria bacterium P01_H01_bin.162]